GPPRGDGDALPGLRDARPPAHRRPRLCRGTGGGGDAPEGAVGRGQPPTAAGEGAAGLHAGAETGRPGRTSSAERSVPRWPPGGEGLTVAIGRSLAWLVLLACTGVGLLALSPLSAAGDLEERAAALVSPLTMAVRDASKPVADILLRAG